ncbi:pentachlorophenol monooxygenase [Phormidesmis priestleyi ULC007]|uniref:Pentachlorophenol monooxygenase n=1 Tax=Phormidesmis priestleyi ULC007 TaxID=1920490 RepID=A0A2T1D362_9CYAN|nr:FAD-dependent monooxygenase [Phormidesmis priestleyi]PSB14928.1 pentachlorophenol monooxygenase [Phormidesmis priestleyi ULC007]PZO45922.1 MAG: pentachlorophenol monooxygenase [Phormidesmis priestleyi]
METTIKTNVVIIGAGPTGLSIACQLARYGVDFVVMDQNEGITPYSKAIGVHARTIEIYEQIGLAQKAVEQGTIAGKVRLLSGGTVRGELHLSNIGAGLSPYPYVLMLEQSKNEKLLYNYLQSHGKEILWQTELQSFSQTDSGVTAQVITSEGATQTIEAQYLVGCDGPKSPTRHTLGLTFEGSTFDRMFYVADAQVDWTLSHDALHVCLSADSFVLFFPLKGEQRYRIIGVFPETFAKDEGDVLYEEIDRRIQEETNLDLNVHAVEWFSTYKVHTRHASRFSKGRCFLAGDAAHIHSPVGAQGMNTGIQDGYNLAWKLALVLQGKADKKLLETYSEERLENAKHLLQTTDRAFQIAAGSEGFLAFLRLNVLPFVAQYILSFDAVKQFIFPMLSQIGIQYRRSSLSQHTADKKFRVKAGDRMPYFRVDGESIYEKLHQPKFHWLMFSNEQSEVRSLEMELESQYAEFVDFNAIPLDPQVAKAFGVNHPFSMLLRPDNYIGFLSTEMTLNELTVYLKKVVGNSQIADENAKLIY